MDQVLSHLSEVEKRHLMTVLLRDKTLRKNEDERVMKLRIDLVREKKIGVIAASDTGSSQSKQTCARCKSVAAAKELARCVECRHLVCVKCRVFDQQLQSLSTDWNIVTSAPDVPNTEKPQQGSNLLISPLGTTTRTNNVFTSTPKVQHRNLRVGSVELVLNSSDVSFYSPGSEASDNAYMSMKSHHHRSSDHGANTDNTNLMSPDILSEDSTLSNTGQFEDGNGGDQTTEMPTEIKSYSVTNPTKDHDTDDKVDDNCVKILINHVNKSVQRNEVKESETTATSKSITGSLYTTCNNTPDISSKMEDVTEDQNVTEDKNEDSLQTLASSSTSSSKSTPQDDCKMLAVQACVSKECDNSFNSNLTTKPSTVLHVNNQAAGMINNFKKNFIENIEYSKNLFKTNIDVGTFKESLNTQLSLVRLVNIKDVLTTLKTNISSSLDEVSQNTATNKTIKGTYNQEVASKLYEMALGHKINTTNSTVDTSTNNVNDCSIDKKGSAADSNILGENPIKIEPAFDATLEKQIPDLKQQIITEQIIEEKSKHPENSASSTSTESSSACPETSCSEGVGKIYPKPKKVNVVSKHRRRFSTSQTKRRKLRKKAKELSRIGFEKELALRRLERQQSYSKLQVRNNSLPMITKTPCTDSGEQNSQGLDTTIDHQRLDHEKFEKQSFSDNPVTNDLKETKKRSASIISFSEMIMKLRKSPEKKQLWVCKICFKTKVVRMKSGDWFYRLSKQEVRLTKKSLPEDGGIYKLSTVTSLSGDINENITRKRATTLSSVYELPHTSLNKLLTFAVNEIDNTTVNTTITTSNTVLGAHIKQRKANFNKRPTSALLHDTLLRFLPGVFL